MRYCVVCDWRVVRANDRCHTCDAYRKRTGHDRPEALLIREGERWLDRQ